MLEVLFKKLQNVSIKIHLIHAFLKDEYKRVKGFKKGDLVVVLNSGGKFGILLREWPAGEYYDYDDHYRTKLLTDGWELWVPDWSGPRQYIVQETWNLEHYEKL